MEEPKDAVRKRLQWCRMILKREMARFESMLAALPAESGGQRNALWLRQIGESLERNPPDSLPGTSEIAIVNIHSGMTEKIPVNPKLSAAKNAELYFKKAKKAEKSGSGALAEQTAITDSLKTLKNEFRKLKEIKPEVPPEIIEEAVKSASAAIEKILPGTLKGITGGSPVTPYRHVEVGGWHVYIGKTDEQNDELSLKFAAPQDLWFHVAGHPGSHVIIRRPKGSPEPSREAIGTAAALSAWYSKQRGTPLVEVHYTAARNVRKCPGAPAGEVIVEQWKVLRVRPCSPDRINEH